MSQRKSSPWLELGHVQQVLQHTPGSSGTRGSATVGFAVHLQGVSWAG